MMYLNKDEARAIQVFANKAPINVPIYQAEANKAFNRIRIMLRSHERNHLTKLWLEMRQGRGRKEFDFYMKQVMKRFIVA